MAVERYGSKTDVVVKLVLVFFIALLSFSIGTFVGKKFSDNQHKLAQLEPTEHSTEVASGEHGTTGSGEERGVASVHPDAGEVKPDKALSDDEIAKLAEEFVTDDDGHGSGEPAKLNDKNGGGHTTASAHGDEHAAEPVAAPASAHGDEHGAPAPSHEPASVKAAPAHAESPKKEKAAAPGHGAPAPAHTTSAEALKPAQRMAEGHSPVIENPAKQASRIPSALPKEVASSAIGKFTVQVASYGTEAEAQTQAADLKGKGFSAFYVSAKVKGSTWYRVNVGLFTTQKEAEAYKKDLMARAKVASAIVQKVASAE